MFTHAAVILITLFVFLGKDSSSVNSNKGRPSDVFYERALRAGLLDIDQEKLSATDIEIRVWEKILLSKNTPSAIIIRKRNGVWSALRLESDSYSLGWLGEVLDKLLGVQTGTSEDNCVVVPKHSWDILYEKLVNTGFLTLTNDSISYKNNGVMDGVVYLVEIRCGAITNRFVCDNPEYFEFSGKKKFFDGLNVLSTELVDE